VRCGKIGLRATKHRMKRHPNKSLSSKIWTRVRENEVFTGTIPKDHIEEAVSKSSHVGDTRRGLGWPFVNGKNTTAR